MKGKWEDNIIRDIPISDYRIEAAVVNDTSRGVALAIQLLDGTDAIIFSDCFGMEADLHQNVALVNWLAHIIGNLLFRAYTAGERAEKNATQRQLNGIRALLKI